MWDKKAGQNVTFDISQIGVSADPKTFSDHVRFATEYQLSRHAFRARTGRERVRMVMHQEMSKYSLMDLRALFLFALFEYDAELRKKQRLNDLERASLWRKMEDQRLVVFDRRSLRYRATDAAENFNYNDSIENDD